MIQRRVGEKDKASDREREAEQERKGEKSSVREEKWKRKERAQFFFTTFTPIPHYLHIHGLQFLI